MFETEKTGVYPIGGEGNRWAIVQNGRVLWAGSHEGCIERWAIVAQPNEPAPPDVLLEAIRRQGG